MNTGCSFTATTAGAMAKASHYTPPLNRFNVCALFHEAKNRNIPMTQLANELIAAGLRQSDGWLKAEAQLKAMRVREGGVKYQTK